MDAETAVRVYNEALGVKGAKGRLLHVKEEGYYEGTLEVKERLYHALLPIGGTVILAADPIPEMETIDIERF
jgi:uncharacterized glyoxalase superfamily protein PhnB